ncbi:expressed unknown protein [Seminavis robusta]|uniref:Uncharacterized protein n=1 Tax=Seminavis robusta TaxID=568900 RepID=A0A9N8HEK9_9STRA|nr:expressed unknown protein [Seminavis robusta]|eukprot:Sro521_g159250.1 n/a (383) ;mRNA; f:9358-10506
MATSVLLRPLPLGESYYSHYSRYQYDTTSAPSYSDSSAESVATGVWNYMAGVGLFLVVWVLTLMLPKGMRKQFFGANPRRYARRRYQASEFGDMSTTFSALMMDSVDESILQEVEKRRLHDMSTLGPPSSTMSSKLQQQQQLQRPQQQSSRGSTVADSESGIESIYLRPMARGTAAKRGKAGSTTTGSTTTNSMFRASPGLFGSSLGHPAIPRLPSAKILNETMQRLKTRGIRLVAHGVASESKRVWIKFEEDTTSLSWQTEFPRKIPNQLGEVSLVMMRGALHRIALPNILYVDVGKKTNAFMKEENKDMLDTVCFSLLTQNGSLDLQANSRLERDALVICFSMILDEVHSQDWRSLYAESPETSAVQSTCTGSDLNQVEF